MPKITINANARSLAHKTGIDKLGQEKLAKLDKNGDGKITLTDVRTLASKANLDKDGVLSRDDRKAINKVLGGRATVVDRGDSDSGGTVRGSHNLRGGGGENNVVVPTPIGGGGESGGGGGGGGGE